MQETFRNIAISFLQWKHFCVWSRDQPGSCEGSLPLSPTDPGFNPQRKWVDALFCTNPIHWQWWAIKYTVKGSICVWSNRSTVQKWTLCVSTYISQWSHDRGGADAWPPEGGRRHQSRSRSIQASSSLIFGKCLSAVGGILEEDKNCCIKTDAGVNNIYWKLHGSETLLFSVTRRSWSDNVSEWVSEWVTLLNRVGWCYPGEWRYLLRTLLKRLW